MSDKEYGEETMREIKFRLRIGGKIVGYERWDKVSGLWRYSKDGMLWQYQGYMSENFIPHTDKDQFTGRYDKNKREIYEGDEIKWPKNIEGVWSDQAGKTEIVKFPFVCGNAYLCEIIGTDLLEKKK